MTPYEIGITLKYLRKIEREMREETFIMVFSAQGIRLWNEFRNLDYSLTVLRECLTSEDIKKLDKYVSDRINDFRCSKF